MSQPYRGIGVIIALHHRSRSSGDFGGPNGIWQWDVFLAPFDGIAMAV
jgi:hypothetical protein